jgi:nitrogen fixation/metabolism regulation signal transduction histidine kinase
MQLTTRFGLQFAFAASLAVAVSVGASLALFTLQLDRTAASISADFSAALERRLAGESARALETAAQATEDAMAAGDRMGMMAAAMEARLEGGAAAVRLYSMTGAALADGDGDPAVFERPAPAPVRGIGAEQGVRRWREGDMLYSGRAICPDDACAGVVVVAVDAVDLATAQAEAQTTLDAAQNALWLHQIALAALAVLAGAALAGLLGATLARRFSRSMEAAVEALEKVAAGEVGVTMPTRDAHMADLANAVDMVAVAMAEAAAKGEPPEESPLLADVPDGLFVADLSGALIVANEALHALFAAPNGALKGADVFETFAAARAEGAEAMAEALRQVSRIERADGVETPVVISVRPTGAGDAQRIIGVAREADPQP